jgi:hypothetical protein
MMALNAAEQALFASTNFWRNYRGPPEVPATIPEFRARRLANFPVVAPVVTVLPPPAVFAAYAPPPVRNANAYFPQNAAEAAEDIRCNNQFSSLL